uniref:HAT C-terminal dimerisation domain-containing protein n=1 Tax=Rhizophagus irregularis (strain DAOM 181602 / DAOM 197198 / MUCL 43194) TaxID=747089 RepID=U9U654_RHIID
MREIRAIDAMTNSNKDPRNFEITDDEWNKIKEIISVLKLNEVEYLHLAVMARDYLVIAAISIPVEQIFSGKTDLIIAKRSNLKKNTIHAYMYLKSWLE